MKLDPEVRHKHFGRDLWDVKCLDNFYFVKPIYRVVKTYEFRFLRRRERKGLQFERGDGFIGFLGLQKLGKELGDYTNQDGLLILKKNQLNQNTLKFQKK